MNINQIKSRLSLSDVLSYLGHELHPHKGVHGLQIKSPFRDEHKPSFKVDLSKQIWFDHGLGEGGDLIKFAQTYNRLVLGKSDSVKIALDWLRDIIGSPNTTPATKKPLNDPIQSSLTISPSENYTITENTTLRIVSLLENLDRRGISREIARNHLRQIRYTRPGKKTEFYGYGFRNISGGYEFSSLINGFKTTLGHKDIILRVQSKNYSRQNRVISI